MSKDATDDCLRSAGIEWSNGIYSLAIAYSSFHIFIGYWSGDDRRTNTSSLNIGKVEAITGRRVTVVFFSYINPV